jgi:hypothetical protein
MSYLFYRNMAPCVPPVYLPGVILHYNPYTTIGQVGGGMSRQFCTEMAPEDGPIPIRPTLSALLTQMSSSITWPFLSPSLDRGHSN